MSRIVDSSVLYHFVLWPILSIVAAGRLTSIRLIISRLFSWVELGPWTQNWIPFVTNNEKESIGRINWWIWWNRFPTPLTKEGHTTTPSFWLTYIFQIIIRTWRWGVSDQIMVCSWQEQDRVLCQVLFRCLKYLIWAGKEFKVKKDFQPWFAEQKAHWSEPGSIRSPPNLVLRPWKFIEIKEIFMGARLSSGGSGSTPAHSNGLFAQRTTVGNLFWLWTLFQLLWGILKI